MTADTITAEDIALSEKLEDQAMRAVAIDVKSAAGGMLAEELSKNHKPEEIQRITEQLIQAKLIVREYAIICQKSSKQISRVTSLEAIHKAAELGFVCSCGRPYSDESI